MQDVGAHMGRLALKDRTTSTSPQKSPHKMRSIAEPVTPTPRRGRPSRRTTQAEMEKDTVVADKPEEVEETSSSSEEDERKPLCRHRIRPFSDRQFYLYRDPRVAREWEVCEKNMKSLVTITGHPFDNAEQNLAV